MSGKTNDSTAQEKQALSRVVAFPGVKQPPPKPVRKRIAKPATVGELRCLWFLSLRRGGEADMHLERYRIVGETTCFYDLDREIRHEDTGIFPPMSRRVSKRWLDEEGFEHFPWEAVTRFLARNRVEIEGYLRNLLRLRRVRRQAKAMLEKSFEISDAVATGKDAKA